MTNTTQIADYAPTDFIEQAQIDADQISHDVSASTMNLSALYYCTETREFVAANYGQLKADHIRLGNILHHMEQVELAKRRNSQ